MDVTVILCTHNRCQSLAVVLENLVRQAMPGSATWEILVVDNNSTDETRNVAEEFATNHPERIRYILETRQGLSFARNAGISQSSARVLAFTDDDVTIETDWLNDLTAELIQGNWAGAGGRIVPLWSRPLPGWLCADDPNTMGPFVAFDAGAEAGELVRAPYGANMAFRREMFEKYGGFRTDLGRSSKNLQGREDIEFASRILARGERLRYEPSAVVYHPAPSERMTQSFVLRWWFWYGFGEVVDLGPPPGARWHVHGIPMSLLRRLARWSVEWMSSSRSQQRFACKRKVWYLAGMISACYRQDTSRNSAGVEIPEISRRPPEHSTWQTDGSR